MCLIAARSAAALCTASHSTCAAIQYMCCHTLLAPCSKHQGMHMQSSISLHCPTRLQGELIREPAAITRHYMAFWFWVDVVATIPFDVLLTAAADMSQGTLTVLGFLKTPRLLRLGRCVPAGWVCLRLTACRCHACLREVCCTLVASTYKSYTHTCPSVQQIYTNNPAKATS